MVPFNPANCVSVQTEIMGIRLRPLERWTHPCFSPRAQGQEASCQPSPFLLCSRCLLSQLSCSPGAVIGLPEDRSSVQLFLEKMDSSDKGMGWGEAVCAKKANTTMLRKKLDHFGQARILASLGNSSMCSVNPAFG